jgi:membrane-bound lytic murein transglycosylase B
MSRAVLLAAALCAALAPIDESRSAVAAVSAADAMTAAASAKTKPHPKKKAKAPPRIPHPGQAAFARELAKDPSAKQRKLTRAAIEKTLDRAQFQPAIIEAITRPAEAKPWRAYRPLFLTDKRVAEGVAFYAQEREALQKISARTGVPPEVIVAIVGVETFYGRNTGKYKALDALATLAFHYPPRSEFFRSELKQLFLLQGPHFPFALNDLSGSYAGAMGLGQFMPSSIAKYGVDGDGDGKIDLWASRADALASIGNYLQGYGWAANAPIADPAQVTVDAELVETPTLEPRRSVGELARLGYVAPAAREQALPATLITLDGEQGAEYWIAYQNFYVISRYNRSPLYCMAVMQLAQAIAAGAGDQTAGPP